MKTLHLSFIVLGVIIFLGLGLKPSHADDTSGVLIQNITVQPYVLKIGDAFTVTATLDNNSTVPIVLDGGKCSIKDTQAQFFTISLDNHTRIKSKNMTCAGVGWSQILDPGKNIIQTSPDSTFFYIATKSGMANVTVTFHYYVKNQTDLALPNIEQTVSKSFLFTIYDNNTIANSLKLANPQIVNKISPPLKQFKSGITPQDVTCKEGLQLVIKAEDHSPACVKLDVAYMLIKRGWAASESAYPGGDSQFVLHTNSTIMPAHLPRSSGLRIPYYEQSRVINYTGFDGIYNETFPYRGTQKDYVLKPGSTGIITFKLEAVASEQQGQDYPIPLPKSLNLTNYAVFYHEITSLEDLSKYPGVTFDGNGNGGFMACSTGPSSRSTCIGGPIGETNHIEAFVTDHPGVDILFEPPLEVLPLTMNATSQVVTMMITADSNAPRGTYLVQLPSGGLDSFLLTVGDRPYHE